eukprot:1156146-Pelagomonas_calceolata.AAC.1
MDVHDYQPAVGGTQDALALFLEAVLSAVRLLTQSLTSTLSMGNPMCERRRSGVEDDVIHDRGECPGL